jgi:hypothetical protein
VADDILPKVGDVIALSWTTDGDVEGISEDISGDYVVLARDMEELLWTMFNRELQRIELFTFDENKNYQRCLPAGWVKDEDDDED